MQRTIAGRIAAIHVSTVEQQVFQVLDQAMPTGLQIRFRFRFRVESVEPKDAVARCQPAGYKLLASVLFFVF